MAGASRPAEGPPSFLDSGGNSAGPTSGFQPGKQAGLAAPANRSRPAASCPRQPGSAGGGLTMRKRGVVAACLALGLVGVLDVAPAAEAHQTPRARTEARQPDQGAHAV